jgi:hypothetical protein
MWPFRKSEIPSGVHELTASKSKGRSRLTDYSWSGSVKGGSE